MLIEELEQLEFRVGDMFLDSDGDVCSIIKIPEEDLRIVIHASNRHPEERKGRLYKPASMEDYLTHRVRKRLGNLSDMIEEKGRDAGLIGPT